MKNSIKNAFSKIKMSDAAKLRIVNTCKDVESERAHTGLILKKPVLAGVCAVLAVLSVATVTATSAIIRLRTNTNNDSHIPNANITENSDRSQNGGYSFACNGVAGDTDRVYFDITVQRDDGKVLTETDKDEYVARFDPVDAYIEFSDGYRKEIYFTMLNDSNDYVYHLEASTLFYNSDRHYLGEEAKIYIGGIKVSLANSDDSPRMICNFMDPVSVTIAVDETLRTVDFETGEFSLLDGGIVIKSCEISASKMFFYGECSVEGPMYDLQGILENAYIICDGKEIPLGAKTDAGTLPDKGFTIGWLTKTVIDPGKVTAICVDGKIIDID